MVPTSRPWVNEGEVGSSSAWLLLSELPSLVQLAGGTLIVAGVAVRLGERNSVG